MTTYVAIDRLGKRFSATEELLKMPKQERDGCHKVVKPFKVETMIWNP